MRQVGSPGSRPGRPGGGIPHPAPQLVGRARIRRWTGTARRFGRAALAIVTALAFTMLLGPVSPAAAASTTDQDVINAFAAGGSITLANDVSVSQGLSLAESTSLTVHLAGYRLSVTGAAATTATPTDPAEVFRQVAIVNGGALTIEGGALDLIGGRAAPGAPGTAPSLVGQAGGNAAPAAYNMGTMTLSAVDVRATGGAAGTGGVGAASAEAGVVGGTGGAGGAGGVGVYNGALGTLVLSDADLTALGGSGGAGGDGGAGGPGARGGDGGLGGNGGAAITNDGTLAVAGSTTGLTGGSAGAGGQGGAGGAGGGLDGLDGNPGTNGPDWSSTNGRANYVALSANGGDDPSTVTVYTDDVADALDALSALPAPWPARTGYALAGWFDAPSGGSEVAGSAPATGQTVYAHWDSMTTDCTPATVAQALRSATDGSTVTLCGDVVSTAQDPSIAVPAGLSVTLDLAGHSLTATGAYAAGGVQLEDGATLTIDDSGTGGSLTATGGGYAAGIALGGRGQLASLIIAGGTITANGGPDAGAGIGGGTGDNGGPVTITGGTVTATGTGDSPGIGGNGGNSNIGDLPSPTKITGGTVYATGGTGIGGGMDTSSGKITISGGTVYATGNQGAGIGSGGDSAHSSVTISGGEVHAIGNQGAAGIGGGAPHADDVVVAISGGTVVATANGSGAGIGGGFYPYTGPTVTISGDADVTATSAGGGAGIGTGYTAYPEDGVTATIDILGGTVVATATSTPNNDDRGWWGAGIGGGSSEPGADLTIAAGASVTASSDRIGAIGPGSDGASFGSIANAGTVTIPADNTITIPSGVTVTNSGTITGSGTLTGAGTVTNTGSITHTVGVGSDLVVTDHHYAVSFDVNGGTGGPGDMTVYAVSFGGAELSLGDLAAPTMDGKVLTGWYLDAETTIGPLDDDSSISDLGSSDGTAVPVTLYAGWGEPCTATGFATDFNGAADGSTVTLCGDVTIDASDGVDLGVAPDKVVTLDLDGHTLDVAEGSDHAGIEVPAGATLIIEDGSGGGTLKAASVLGAGIGASGTQDAGKITIAGGTIVATGGYNSAAIGGSNGGAGGQVTISGGTVTATSTSSGAGIGGGESEQSSGTVLISGGTVTATGGYGGAGIGGGPGASGAVTISGGTVTATGGFGGAGIGGGFLADGGTVTISGGTVTATGTGTGAGIGGGQGGAGASVTIGAEASVTVSSAEVGAIGPGTGGTGFGSLANAGSLTIPAGNSMTVPAGVTVTDGGTLTVAGSITNAGTITGSGTLTGDGTVDNAGSIWHTVTVHAGTDALTVTDHHYLLSFDATGGSGAPSDLTVYAATLADTGLSTSGWPVPTRTGFEFTGWYADADATGDPVGDQTVLSAAASDGTPVAVPLYAGWDSLPPTTTSVPTTTTPTTTEPTTTVPTTTVPTTTVPTTTVPTTTVPTTTVPTTTVPTTMEPTEPTASTSTAPTSPVAPPLSVATANLPDGTVGSTYLAALRATGGSDNAYHWIVASGALPPGLSLSDSGVITGTPTEAGTFTFTVSVNDPATAELTITVHPGAAVLPDTGTPGWVIPAGVAGLVLLAAGALIVAASRRREPREH